MAADDHRRWLGGGWTRREVLRVGAAAAAGATVLGRLGALALADAPPPARPNIILAMTDDQGWAQTGYASKGLVHTPVLDEMAAKGIRFDRFYAAHPVCSPTRGSCLTGRHPNRYGCFSWGYDLPLEELCLAKVLKAAGYATGHFGKWHLGGIPTRRGKTNLGKWKHKAAPHPGNHGFEEWFSYWNFFDMNPPGFYHNGEAVGALKGEGSIITVDRAIPWIRSAVKAGRPFFAVVWFGNPHNPHKAAAEDRRHYAKLPEKLQHYYGEISGVDRAMGKLRAALRESGVADNTMLWFTSDNGCRDGTTGGLRGRKSQLWEGGVRVPGILEWPARVTKPFATAVPCSTMDYFPTTLDLLGLKPKDLVEPIDGISLMPLIGGRMAERPRPIPFEWRKGKGKPGWAALTGNRFKLHRQQGKVALYDVAADGGEKTNVAVEHPKVVAEMAARLDAWQKSVEGSLAEKDYKQS
jgi:arylsulfatase A-like enzyme